jgi:addiction module HigA family antidote
MAEMLDEIHPGEILLEEFMKPLGITARQLAADIDVPPSRISEIVNARRPITADTALRLGLFFQMEPRFWLNLQTEYDLRVTERAAKERIQARVRAFNPEAGCPRENRVREDFSLIFPSRTPGHPLSSKRDSTTPGHPLCFNAGRRRGSLSGDPIPRKE